MILMFSAKRLRLDLTVALLSTSGNKNGVQGFTGRKMADNTVILLAESKVTQAGFLKEDV